MAGGRAHLVAETAHVGRVTQHLVGLGRDHPERRPVDPGCRLPVGKAIERILPGRTSPRDGLLQVAQRLIVRPYPQPARGQKNRDGGTARGQPVPNQIHLQPALGVLHRDPRLVPKNTRLAIWSASGKRTRVEAMMTPRSAPSRCTWRRHGERRPSVAGRADPVISSCWP